MASAGKIKVRQLEPFVPNRYAREQAIAIAADRIDYMSGEQQASGLAQIDALLDKWKVGQAVPDGTVEKPRARGLLGMTLSELSDFGNRPSKRVHIDTLLPHECAGLDCAADLWLKLWSEQYPETIAISEDLALDRVLALLVQRDGLTMGADSLATAIRFIWIYVWASSKASASWLREGERVRLAKLAKASADGVATLKMKTETRHREWNTIAHKTWTADLKLTTVAVATSVREELARRLRSGEKLPSVRRIIDVIGPMKEMAFTTVSRAYKHKRGT